MRLKCAIFDFDGTLFDSMPVWDTLGERYLRSIGLTPQPDTAETIRTMSLAQSARYFKATYHLPDSVKTIIADIDGLIADFYQKDVKPKPGAKTFVHQIKASGASVCIATATDRPLIEAALARYEMTDDISHIFTCSEVGHGKDNPDIYRRALAFCHANRRDTIVFEDALHAAQTAKADGFITVGVYDKSEPNQTVMRALCDGYIKNFNDTEVFWRFLANRH